MTHYDLVVIGTGSGNTIVNRSFEGWKVAIVEDGPYGGTCLNRGCIPSKMYVAAADIAREAREEGPRLGVRTRYDGVDWTDVRDRIFGRLDGNARAGKEYREGQAHVDAITGTARFSGERTFEVTLADGGTTEVSGDQVVLAAGGRPFIPPIEGLADLPEHLWCTSDTVMRLDALPERVGVAGGGYVGVEMADVFHALGSQVVQAHVADRLLNTQDAEIAARFTAIAQRRWDVRLDAPVKAVTHSTVDGKDVVTLHLADGSVADVDLLLVAAGRRPNSDRLGLWAGPDDLPVVEAAGVEVDDDGRVVVDEHQRTTAAGVWALGDLSSPQPLKHVANQDARVVQHNLLRPDDLVVSDHRFVPQAVFSSPQVAAVGLTEEEAREQGLDLAVVTHDYASTAHGWALELPEDECVVKLLGDRATGQLVGAHLLGPEASNLVQPLIQAMSFGQPVAGLARGQYWIHPAMAEVVEGALLDLEHEMSATGEGARHERAPRSGAEVE